MSEPQRVSNDGEAGSEGGVILTPIPSTVYQEHMARVRASISLGDDVVESIMVVLEPSGCVATIKARTAAGDVSESFQVEATDDLRFALEDMLDTHREAVRDLLLDGITKTLVAALAAAPPSTN